MALDMMPKQPPSLVSEAGRSGADTIFMRTLYVLIGALLGTLGGAAVADFFGPSLLTLDTVLLGALPGAALASWIAWRLSAVRRKRRGGRSARR